MILYEQPSTPSPCHTPRADKAVYVFPTGDHGGAAARHDLDSVDADLWRCDSPRALGSGAVCEGTSVN
jgi:hypothetical protein